MGIVGGFIGVGGGYMVTPALIVFGFPGYMASGIDMTHIAGKAVISTIRHRQLGNIDWTLALSMVAGTMLGVELGVRLLVYFKNLGISGVVLLTTSVVVMFGLFLYTQIETQRSHKKIDADADGRQGNRPRGQSQHTAPFFQSIPIMPIVRCRTARVVISMWVIVLVGVVTGVLAGFLGVGGGFIRVPALVYLVGASTHIAVGTDLVEIVVSGGYGALRHSMEGNVDMMAVLFMIIGAMFGAQFGSIATSYVRGPAIRYILSYSLILATVGAAHAADLRAHRQNGRVAVLHRRGVHPGRDDLPVPVHLLAGLVRRALPARQIGPGLGAGHGGTGDLIRGMRLSQVRS